MRLVSLSPSITEIIFALGAGDSIVANTAYCDFPEAAKKIPKVGSWIYVNDETVKKFRPDLVITSTIVQQNADERYKDFQHLHLDPRSLDDIYQSIIILGNAINRETAAKKLVKQMKTEEDKIRKQKTKTTPRAYIEEWFKPPMASGNWVPDIVELAGGNYFPGIKKGEISRKVSDEEIIAFDPEVIFVSYCGYKDKSDPKIVLERSGWENIAAIKTGRVHVLNDDFLNRPGPRILESAKAINTIIQPLH